MEIINKLRDFDFKFNKKFGQNFLSDEALLDRIVDKAEISKEDTVIEIGVGAGTLTRAIAKKAGKVIGYEIDTNLKEVLDFSLAGLNNVEIVFKDIMKEKMEDLEKDLKDYVVIANLPYYITSPIILEFVKKSTKCKKIVVTIQKEVGDRICAKPKTSDYGTLTVTCNVIGDTEILEYIDRTKFYPSPNVDSVVVKIDINRNKYNIKDYNHLDSLIKASFLNRRKTLVNNLMSNFHLKREYSLELLGKINKNENARAEELSSLDFVNLSNLILEEK